MAGPPNASIAASSWRSTPDRTVAAYPATARARDAFIVSRRPARPAHDPRRPQGMTVEQEPTASGRLADVVTVFLTGRECPWRCAMCDLWKYTTEQDTPLGAIPHQLREALRLVAPQLDEDRPLRLGASRLAQGRHIKLYNAGSFFDPRAVPPSDYGAIASAVAGFSRVIVESHPALIGPRVDEWRDALDGEAAGRAPQLEVAMGLETANPGALERLNKQMTLDQFRRAAGELARRDIALRVFVLVAPPFVAASEQAHWLGRSVDLAFDCGASVVSLIPMRDGNGAVEALADEGLYDAPTLDGLEAAMEQAIEGARGRVFADLWDLERLASCAECFGARQARLARMNLTQRAVARVSCEVCSHAEARA
jgi:archaeosine synthase beta-subunit